MNPAGFLSYTHFDNQNDDGFISGLAIRIATEIQAQSGTSFEIFIDRKDIQWGQAWKERLDNSLDATTFFFPVLTPSYFRSKYCLDEALRFLNREQKLDRYDLILPIYYIHVSEVPDNASNIWEKLLAHQYLDWRELRFEPLTTPGVRRRIASAAGDVCKAMDDFVKHNWQESSEQGLFENAEHSEIASSGASTKSSVPERVDDSNVIIVDPTFKPPLNTITGAISLAEPGMRILIRPGVYYESLVLQQPLELIGMGESPKEVKVHGGSEPTLSIQTSLCRICNIAFYQNSSESIPAAVVTQGRPDIQNCDFSSSVGSGLIISNASPWIRNSSIHNSLEFGIIFEAQSRGTIEDCDIYENGLANILIRQHSNPMVRHNTIHNGYQSGIYVHEGGQGLIEENDIYNNSHAGLATSHEGSPVVRNNRITRSLHYGGIYIFRRGSGVFENNDLRGNIKGGLQATEKCQPNIRSVNNQE